MNWLKKPAPPLLRKVVILTISINVVVMFLIEQYLAGIIFILILLGDFLNNKNLKKTDKEINTDIAEAMAKKIVEDARMHRIARKSIEKNK
ncbi:MAG: hypothetical protein VX517_02665 [Candidatus Neomarinimicrobiota bacterium]|nr:hypothetical protein [Candidatus Neomarinimicrobiota bacterium]